MIPRQNRKRKFTLKKEYFNCTNNKEINLFCKIRKLITSDYKSNANKQYGDFDMSIFMYTITNEETNISDFKHLLDNKFICQDSKDKIGEIFSKIKKTYNSLKRFEHICLWKLSKIYPNEEDLCMNPLSHFQKDP